MHRCLCKTFIQRYRRIGIYLGYEGVTEDILTHITAKINEFCTFEQPYYYCYLLYKDSPHQKNSLKPRLDKPKCYRVKTLMVLD